MKEPWSGRDSAMGCRARSTSPVGGLRQALANLCRNRQRSAVTNRDAV